MSTLLYASRTRQRQSGVAVAGDSTWVDTLLALVPAEVLAAHAIAINAWTKTSEPAPGSDEGVISTITKPDLLQVSFWVFIVLAAVLFALAKKDDWRRSDVLRMMIPAGAFVVWSMANKNTAFDAVVVNMDGGLRAVIAAVAAALLIAVAKRMSDSARVE